MIDDAKKTDLQDLFRFRELTGIQMVILFATIVLGVCLRFLVSRLGYNYDFESFLIVGKIVNQGGNVYAETSRYNYGPVFSLIQGTAYWLASVLSRFSAQQELIYRCLIILLLTAADLYLMFLILARTTLINAVIFFLNPVSILITGYHNQFDNLAVLFGILAIGMVNDQPGFNRRDIACIFLLAISLTTKHLLYAFPVWILLNQTLPFRKRVAYAVLPVAIFTCSFVPYAYRGAAGILVNVFKYQSINNYPLFFQNAVDLNRLLGISSDIACQQYFRLIFVFLMMIAAFRFRKQSIQEGLLLYFLCLVCFSSAIANQYLAIPLVSIFLLKDRLRYLYIALMGLYLCLHSDGLNQIGLYPDIKLFNDFVFYGYNIAVWILFAVIMHSRYFPRCDRLEST